MTRFRFPLLCSALLLAGVAAAQIPQSVLVHFYKTWDGVDVSTAYGPWTAELDEQGYYMPTDVALPSDGLTDPGLRLIDGEIFRVLAVSSATTGYGKDDPIPFTIDALGNVVGLPEGSYAWQTCLHGDTAVTTTDFPVNAIPGEGQSATGVPLATEKDVANGYVSLTFSIAHNASLPHVTLYLVTLDTRRPDGSAWSAGDAGYTVARYGVSYLAGFTTGGLFSMPINVYVGRPATTSYAACYGNPAPVRPTAGLTEYGELSGADLAKALTPTLKPAGSSDSDALAVIPSVGLNLYRYTVETTGVLGEEWEPLDTWVEREGVSGGSPFGYSAVVPDGQTELTLPRKDGESQRFYRLVAPGK